MEKRIYVFFAIVIVAILASLLTVGNALVDNRCQVANSTAFACESDENLSSMPPKPSDFVFEGCWAYFPAGPCYDIYRDSAGDYWICKKCLETKHPSPKTCSRISLEVLNRGYWCL